VTQRPWILILLVYISKDGKSVKTSNKLGLEKSNLSSSTTLSLSRRLFYSPFTNEISVTYPYGQAATQA